MSSSVIAFHLLTFFTPLLFQLGSSKNFFLLSKSLLFFFSQPLFFSDSSLLLEFKFMLGELLEHCLNLMPGDESSLIEIYFIPDVIPAFLADSVRSLDVLTFACLGELSDELDHSFSV